MKTWNNLSLKEKIEYCYKYGLTEDKGKSKYEAEFKMQPIKQQLDSILDNGYTTDYIIDSEFEEHEVDIYDKDNVIEDLESIVEDVALKFGDWILEEVLEGRRKITTTKQLFEIFKKENNL